MAGHAPRSAAAPADRPAALAGLLGGTSPQSSANATANWTQISTGTAPPLRVYMSMTYDPAERAVVLFGGVAYATVYGDTWEYANGIWTNVTPRVPNATNTPPARWGGAMAFDPAEGGLVLFGGANYSSPHPFNDTWLFLNGSWTNRTGGNAPSERSGSALGYDPSGREMVLFGGVGSSSRYLADSWTFVNGTWTNRTVAPSPRAGYGASMAYDRADGYLLLIGGYGVHGALNGSWSFSNGTWTNRTAGNHLPARYIAAMDYDAADGYIVLQGGCVVPSNCNGGYTDTWKYAQGAWTKLSPSTKPPGYWGDGAAFDVRDGYFVEFAGGGGSNQTWAYGSVVIASAAATPPSVDLGQTTHLELQTKWAVPGLTYAYAGLPPGCSSENRSVLACAPDGTGAFVVTINVSLGAWSYPSRTVALAVYGDPTVDSFTVAPSVADEDQAVTFNTTTSSANGTLGYAYSGLPPGCGSRNASSFVCAPTTAGNYSIVLTVTDDRGYQLTDRAALWVNPDPKVVEATATPATIDLGQSTVFAVTATGGTGPLSYDYSGLPPGCAAQDSPRLLCTPTATGLFRGEVQVNDSAYGTLGTLVDLTVNPVPRVLGLSIAPSSIDLGNATSFTLNVSGGSGFLRINYSGLPDGCAASDVRSFGCTPGVTGTFAVGVTVTDQVQVRATGSAVLIVNADPTVKAFGASRPAIDLGQSTTFTVSVGGGTSPFTFTYSGLPPGCRAAPGSSLSCAPTALGRYSLGVTVVDAVGFAASRTAALAVDADLRVAAFTATPSSLLVNESVTLAAVAVGGSGPLTFAYHGLPNGCTTVNRTEVTCRPVQPGIFTVGVNVSDAVGFSSSASVTVTVAAALPAAAGSTGGVPPVVTYSILALGAAAAAGGLLAWRRRARPRPGRPSDTEAAEADSGEGTAQPD